MQSFPLQVDFYKNLDQSSIVASLIDHTLLKPEAAKPEIARLCTEARQHSFASVCVHPFWVRFAAAELKGSPVKVCAVVGFPLGANETRTKLFEADAAIAQGASELDMVQNIGALHSGDRQYIYAEIEQVAELAHNGGAVLKVILETCLLNEKQKLQACHLAVEARADFVKTSTGFSTGGATREDVVLMRNAVGPNLGVKASGGIRSLATLREMVYAGANRIGTSSGVQILRQLEQQATEMQHSLERGASY
jgi:deoxyribose-phosphate aldolase